MALTNSSSTRQPIRWSSGMANLVERLVAAAAAGEALGIGLEPQRALAAEDPGLGRRRERGHGAEPEVPDGARAEHGQDVDVVGHLHLVHRAARVLAARHRDLRHGRHAVGGAEPAQHRLVPDAHVQDVVAAERDVLPPVERRRPARRNFPGRPGARRRAPRRRSPRRGAAGSVESTSRVCGAGTSWVTSSGAFCEAVEHLPALGRVHRHPRLAQHVLAVLERGQVISQCVYGHVPMHTASTSAASRPRASRRARARCRTPWPRARRTPCCGSPPRRARRRRASGSSGMCRVTSVVARADEPYADRLVAHGATL